MFRLFFEDITIILQSCHGHLPLKFGYYVKLILGSDDQAEETEISVWHPNPK